MQNPWAIFIKSFVQLSTYYGRELLEILQRICPVIRCWSCHNFNQSQGVFDPRVPMTSCVIWSFSSAKKIFPFTWNLLAGVERVKRERYKTSHFQVSQLSFEEFTRKLAIMGKDTKENKEIEKIQVEIHVRSAPDGGWGWLVCLAGFIAQFVVLGIQNNTGIIYKALLEEFKQSKGETSMYFEFLTMYCLANHREVSYLLQHDFKSGCSVRNVNSSRVNSAVQL